MSTWQERYEQRLVEVEQDNREEAQVKALCDLAANMTNIVELLTVIAAALGRIAATLEHADLPTPYPDSISLDGLSCGYCGRTDGLHDHDCVYYDRD